MSEITDTRTDTASREGWLTRAGQVMRLMIEQVSGIKVPDFHVSMGFGGQRYERGVRGICWHSSVSADGRNHVFISPELSDTGVVLSVLLHEMLHVALDNADGHTKRFSEYATRLGLLAPFTSARPDEALTAELMVMAAELGDFPHAALHVASRPADVPVQVDPAGNPIEVPKVTSGPKAQTNRWFVFECPEHARPIRMSRGAAAEGAPFCGHRDADGVPCLKETEPRG